jgi:hypothetical protein
MAYVGQAVNIPLGQQGLLTDVPQSQIPLTALTKANNVRFNVAGIDKAPGSIKFNATALGAGDAIVGLHDWFPTPAIQRLIALTDAGDLYRDTGSGTFGGGTPIDSTFGAPTTDSLFVEGGNETAADNRKLFIFTASRALSYIDGDAAGVTNATAAADWGGGNHPTGGFIFKDRLIAFGNANFPHQLYISPAADQTDFTTPTLLRVFPGESDKLVAGIVYKGKAFLFKSPTGVYFLDDRGSNTATDWTVQRIDSSFGLASPHAVVQILDDLILSNANGGITSLKATEAFGDLRSGDILANAKIENLLRTLYTKAGTGATQSIYYNEKKLGYFSFRTKGAPSNDNLLVIDVNQPTPRISLNTRDPANVLALRSDTDGIKRPIRGTDDGFVFLMDQTGVFTVNGSAYVGEFQTPDIDFSELDPTLAARNKLFDFLSLTFTGRSITTILVEVFVDGKSIETLEFPQAVGAALDTFVLDTDTLQEITIASRRQPLHGFGKRIRFRVFNTAATEFNIENFQVEFRLGDEGDK